MYGAGVNWPGEIVDLGSESGLIEKSGSFLLLEGRAHRTGARQGLRPCRRAPGDRRGDYIVSTWSRHERPRIAAWERSAPTVFLRPRR